MWQKRRKTLLGCVGVLYLIFGVLAFFDLPGGHEEHHHTVAHNVTHIVLGLVVLILTLSFRAGARQFLCLAFAASYFIIALCGALAGRHSMLRIVPGFIEFHAGDYAVHGATGLVFLALGLLRRSDTSPVRDARV